jgi:hypothetical protein
MDGNTNLAQEWGRLNTQEGRAQMIRELRFILNCVQQIIDSYPLAFNLIAGFTIDPIWSSDQIDSLKKLYVEIQRILNLWTNQIIRHLNDQQRFHDSDKDFTEIIDEFLAANQPIGEEEDVDQLEIGPEIPISDVGETNRTLEGVESKNRGIRITKIKTKAGLEVEIKADEESIKQKMKEMIQVGNQLRVNPTEELMNRPRILRAEIGELTRRIKQNNHLIRFAFYDQNLERRKFPKEYLDRYEKNFNEIIDLSEEIQNNNPNEKRMKKFFYKIESITR